MARNRSYFALLGLLLGAQTVCGQFGVRVAKGAPQTTAVAGQEASSTGDKPVEAGDDEVSPADAAAVKKAFAMLSSQLKKERYSAVSLMSTERAFEDYFVSKFSQAIAMSGAIGPFPGRELAILKEHKLDEIDFEDLFMSEAAAKAQVKLRERILAPFKGRQAMTAALAELSKQSKAPAREGMAMMDAFELDFVGGEVIGVEKSPKGVMLVVKPKMPEFAAMGAFAAPAGGIELDGPPAGIIVGPGEVPEGAEIMNIIVGPDGTAVAEGGALPEGIEIAEFAPEMAGGAAVPAGMMMGIPDFYLRFLKDGERWKWDGVDEERMMLEAGASFAAQRPTIENPEFSGTAFSGDEINLKDYRGKVVLIDFWGTWCKPCVAELPKLKRIYEVLKPHGLEIIGIAADNKATLTKFFESKSLPWQNIIDGQAGELAAKFDVNAFPTTLLIDREGNHVASNMQGRQIVSELRKHLKLDDKTTELLELAIRGEL